MSSVSDIAHRLSVLVALALYRGLWISFRIVRNLIIGVAAVSLSIATVVAAATWEVSLQFPEDSRVLLDGRERGSITVLDAEGGLLGVRGERFQTVTVPEAGGTLIDAVLATEDRRFFWHIGVDPIGVARAILVNWRSGRTAQGGSSITQQVAKLAFAGRERDFERKLRELAYALALEVLYTKEEILEIYINRVYLGAGAFGFKAAAKIYFDVELDQVSPAQAALLAGLLRAPSRWSPTNNFAAAQERARITLETMYRAEALTDVELLLAMAEIDVMTPPIIPERASYFVDWTAEQVPDEVWEKADDVIVHTTLDPSAQEASEKAIETVFVEHAGRDADAEAAMVLLTKDGAVRAMVGGRDYGRSQFNRAAQARRQLGSAYKPFVYAAAFESGVSAGAEVLDAPVTIYSAGKPWSPKNYAHKYRGWIPLSVALARSSNVAAVRLSQRAGIGRLVDMSRRFGFIDEIPAFPSLALGIIETNPLEVAGAYAVFNRGGAKTPTYGFTKITDRAGDVLWEFAPPPREQIIPVRHAQWMVALLRGVVEAGTGRRARLEDRPSAGKTGTTQDYSDAWFAGFTGDYVAVVWMGNDDRQVKLHRVTGGSLPAMIWKELMASVHVGVPVTELVESALPSSYESIGDGETVGGGGGGGRRRSSAVRAAETEAAEAARRAARRASDARAERAAERRRRRRERIRERWD